MFSEDLVDIKQEPPDEVDEDLQSILNGDVQLMEVRPGHRNVSSLISSETTDLLSDDESSAQTNGNKEKKIHEKKKNGCNLKANLKCKFTFCDFRARKISELKRHEDKHSIPGSYYECKFCKFMTPIYQKLQEHEAKHTNTKPFKCRKCSYRSRYRADIYHHSAKHLVDKKFKCPHKGCNFLTKWRRNIHHHVLTHSDERPHECNICEFKFKRVQDLKYHLYRHNDVKPISCDECDFRCKTNYELGCHKLKHSTVRNFPCTFPGCTQRTKTKSDLTKHMKTHSKVRDHLCPVCGKGFHMRNSLTRHIERHQDVRNYQCGLCSKSFKTKATLRAHMQVHSGIKPWTCNICHRDFLNKWNMMKHKETHGENRPFKCPICPYGARVGEHLLAHIGTMHGKSFAYYCEVCKKPWRRFSQLQIHMKRMHKGALLSSFGNSMKMNIKLEPGLDGDIATGCDLISVKKIDPTNSEQFKHKRGRPPKIKKEPIDEAGMTLSESRDGGDPVMAVVEALVSQQKVPSIHPSDSLPIQTKHEIPTDVGPAKIVSFGEFRLPLATKGFPFNYEKNGKKPNSWFMNPENMHGKAADKQQAYLEKKERDFERRFGRKLGWRRFRLRKKPKLGNSYSKVSSKKESDLNSVKEETDDCVSHTCTKKKTYKTIHNKQDGKSNLKGEKTKQRKQNPMELLIEGRKKLILMRKIKRRQKRWKQRMAEIMPSEESDDNVSLMSETKPNEECSIEDLKDDNFPLSSETKPNEYDWSVIKENIESSDQDDDIPLSKLRNSEDLDDLPLSFLKAKVTRAGKTSQIYTSCSPLLESRLSKQPPKPRKNKRVFQNTVVHKTKFVEKAKKRKIGQETPAVMGTNFYSGSVRILSKTLVANESRTEKCGEYCRTEESSSVNKHNVNQSKSGATLKLKGNKIENIVAKLKAKKFGSEFQNVEIATAKDPIRNVKKKAGRPRGSKNKVRVNESEFYSRVSQGSLMSDVIKPSVTVQSKSRRGRPKGSKNRLKSDHEKSLDTSVCAVSTTEQHSVLKSILQNIHTSLLTPLMSTLSASVKLTKCPEAKCVENKVKNVSSSTVQKESNAQLTSSINEMSTLSLNTNEKPKKYKKAKCFQKESNSQSASFMNEMSTLSLSTNEKPKKYKEAKCVKKKVNGTRPNTILKGNAEQPNLYQYKVRKVGRPKGSKNGVNKKQYFQKKKLSMLAQKADSEKGKWIHSKINSTNVSTTLKSGTVCKVERGKLIHSKIKSMNVSTTLKSGTVCKVEKGKLIHSKIKSSSANTTLKSGTVCKVILDKTWDLSKKMNNTKDNRLSLTQNSTPEKQTKPIPSASKRPIQSKCGKCKDVINAQLKNKLLDKISKQSTKLLSDPDLVLCVPKQNPSLVDVSQNHNLTQKKVGRPKGSKNKMSSKYVTSKPCSKTVKLKRKSEKKSDKSIFKKNREKKLKITKLDSKDKAKDSDNKRIKKKTKIGLKTRKPGINKLLKVNKKIQKCLKMKIIKGNKKVSSILKRKKMVCALGSIKAKSKNKNKRSEEVWYIDIEREEPLTNPALVKYEPTELYMETVTQINSQVDKALFLPYTATETHIPDIKSEPHEPMVKRQYLTVSEFASTVPEFTSSVPYPVKPESVLTISEFTSTVPYAVKAEDSEDVCIYLEHAQAWGVRQDTDRNQPESSDTQELEVKIERIHADDSISSQFSNHLSIPIQSDDGHAHYGGDSECVLEANVNVPHFNSVLEAGVSVPIQSDDGLVHYGGDSESVLEANVNVPIQSDDGHAHYGRDSESVLEANNVPIQSDDGLVHCGGDSESVLEANVNVPHFNSDTSVLEAGVSVPIQSDVGLVHCEADSECEFALEANIDVPALTFNSVMPDGISQAVNVDSTVFIIQSDHVVVDEDSDDLLNVSNVEVTHDDGNLMTSEMADRNICNRNPFTSSNIDLPYSESESVNIENDVPVSSYSDSEVVNIKTKSPTSSYSLSNVEH